MNSPPTRVSVVIPTRNEGKVIHECLSSVFKQSLKPYEVIVVDGRSTDDTLKKARRFPVRILIETEPTSLANARNIGIRNAKGNILLLIDADVVLHKDCLKYGIERFKNPNVLVAFPAEEPAVHTHLEMIQSKWFKGSKSSVNIGVRRSSISAFAGFFRKDIFDKIEFDPSLGFGEDDDFYLRLENLFTDLKIAFPKSSKVCVHEPHSLSELYSRYTWWGRTFRYYLDKHRGMKTILNLASLLLPTTTLILAIASLLFMPLYLAPVSLFILLVTRSLIVCIRSKSPYIVEFVMFDFARSLFFTIGIIQSFFVRIKGK